MRYVLIVLTIIAIYVIGTIFHEIGHFFWCRKYGVTVNEMCFGIGPTLLKKKIGDTLYSIKLFPIAGACIIDDESLSKAYWLKKIMINLGGVINNFILALLPVLIINLIFPTDGFSISNALIRTVEKIGSVYRMEFESLSLIFTGNVRINELSGPIMVVKSLADIVATSKALSFVYMIVNVNALLNILMSTFNAIPLPALDGGHVAIVIIDKVLDMTVHKKIPEKVINRIDILGLCVFTTLTFFVCILDFI